MADFSLDSSLPFDATELPTFQVYRPLRDPFYVTGLLLLTLSLGIFFFSNQPGRGDFFGVIMLHYAIAMVYAVFLAVRGRVCWWLFGTHREHYPTMLLSLLIWMVSCFALNREMRVFKPSADWLNVHLLLSGAACIAYAWQERMSQAARMVLWAVLGATTLLFAYYAVATAPLFALGMVAFWFFGLPLHGMIASVFTIYLVLILRNAVREHSMARWPVFAGMALPALTVLIFAGQWFMLNQKVIESLREARVHGDQSLPHWVSVSQHLENTPTTGKMLKAIADGTVRSRRSPLDWVFLMDDNADRNDPLMQVAGAISPVPDLTREECADIYTSLYDSRHAAEERLWSGNNLETKTVDTRAMIDPGHRLAYTEKTLTVGHKTLDAEGRGPTTQEAIYTFFLPAGGVVTSLSLWVNGQEQPARLTTKSKAKEAYTTIVGQERRDPAVVQWQEGNTVQVRVFPVTPDEPRRFKIGVTAPLRLAGQELTYENVTFDGPPALLATERDSLFFERNGSFSDVPAFFEKTSAGGASYSGVYRHGWSVDCAAGPLSHAVFSFDGKTYTALSYAPQMEAFQPENIYLDLNWAWTISEWQALQKMLKGRSVFVPNATGFEPLTEKNAGALFRKAKQSRFSLFPFHRLEKTETALVIAKSAHPTPRPTDLGESDFRKGIEGLASRVPIRVFHLGNNAAEASDLSAYLRTLTEARSIFCQPGALSDLQKALAENRFLKNPENERTVALPSAGLLLAVQDSAQTLSSRQGAPDHLFRLFAYNRILRDLGPQREEPADLVRLAEQANVVTPISSLVTLETQADYDRFGIRPTDGLNALGNASLGNAGAVPEPHEWALIVLLTVVVVWGWRRRF